MSSKSLKQSLPARRRDVGAADNAVVLPRLVAENAPLPARQQLLLMYSHFQADMPNDGQTPVATWLQGYVREHGLPSLLRFGPRHKPQVFRKDEFKAWLQPLLGREAR
ncbi:MAG: hypothetical protein OHK0012_12800 [Synechococcales cyanobacterium]